MFEGIAEQLIMPGLTVRSRFVEPNKVPTLLCKVSERVSVIAWGRLMILLSERPMVTFALVNEEGKKFDILILLPVVVIETLPIVHPFSQKSPVDALAMEATFHPVV